MDTPSLLLLVVAALAALAVILLVVLLLRRPVAAVQADAGERTRLLAELQSERDAARDQAAESGRLQGRLGALEAELSAHAAQRARDAAQLTELQQRLDSDRVELRTATHALADRESALLQAREQIATADAELARLRDRLGSVQREHAEATANLLHAKQAQADMQAFLGDAQNKLSASFAELAGKVFDERGQAFEKNVRTATAQGKVDIETLLKPFADKLGEFRSRVDTLYGEEAKERSALLGAVTELKTLNQDMAGHTAALTRALKGSSKVRGDWGELMLESVLRGSGLEEGQHYERQAGVRDEDGKALRPDILVRLPDDRCVVVDSKVNLVAWQEAMNAVDEPELHGLALQRHADGLRRHVKDLGDRAYPKAVGDNALDVTIAFVPIEGALSAALGTDPTLQTYAFERKVVFASPNTLMALLRVVDRLWARDKMQKQALDIGDAGGKVLDALMGFLADFDAVGKKLDDASKSFGDAQRKLRESNQSVVKRAQRLVDLGARGRKQLRDELRDSPADLLPAAGGKASRPRLLASPEGAQDEADSGLEDSSPEDRLEENQDQP
ncbi:DNA recombination protein RmuC [Luteimonas sp. RIT-PG2_3]